MLQFNIYCDVMANNQNHIQIIKLTNYMKMIFETCVRYNTFLEIILNHENLCFIMILIDFCIPNIDIVTLKYTTC